MGLFDKYAPGFTAECLIYSQTGNLTHGHVNATDALCVSCNYFFYVLGDLNNAEYPVETAKALGLGVPTGIELTENAHLAALENIRANALEARMNSICADLRSVSERFSPGSFSCCISNPPYFSAGAASQTLPLARQELSCTPEDLFRAAAWALKFGGDFYLVHKPERLAELIATAARFSLESKRLCLVRHKADSPVNLILLQFRKGGKPGLNWEELTLHNSDGTPTDAYRKIYHI